VTDTQVTSAVINLQFSRDPDMSLNIVTVEREINEISTGFTCCSGSGDMKCTHSFGGEIFKNLFRIMAGILTILT